MVSLQTDFFDFRHISLNHAEGQVDSVSLNGRDGGGDFCAVKTFIDVLALEFLFSPVSQGLIKRTAIR